MPGVRNDLVLLIRSQLENHKFRTVSTYTAESTMWEKTAHFLCTETNRFCSDLDSGSCP